MGRSKGTPNRKPNSGNQVKLKPGSILFDTTKTLWNLGRSIGAGGFGDVHLVSNDLSGYVPSDSKWVAKVELLTNGPLFVEMHFYLRVGLESNINKWKEDHGLKHLGMPRCIGFGSHLSGAYCYRFLVLERYGHDINSLFVKNGRRFSLKTVLALGLQIIDILEYIHYYGYIHADIKGSNLVLGLGKKDENKVFLLDFGLACLFVDRYGRHKEFNHDLRRAHDGTLEYTSRDAHVGAHSRRGDLEVLGYNLVQWLCGELPWENDLSDPDVVAAAKNLYMSNTSHLMDKCFPRGGAPVVIHQYLRYVAGLGFTAKPDYSRLRSMFRQGMKAAGLADNGLLNLGSIANMKISKKRGHGSDNENINVSKKSKITAKSLRRPCAPVQFNIPPIRHLKSKLQLIRNNCKEMPCERRTRQKSMVGRTGSVRSEEFDWVKVLQSHPEKKAKPKAKVKKPKRVVQRALEDVAEVLRRKPENSRANPTPAMLQILESKRRVKGRSAKRNARSESHNRRSPSPEPVYFTPAMEEIVNKKNSEQQQNNLEPTIPSQPPRELRDRKATFNSIPSVPKLVLHRKTCLIGDDTSTTTWELSDRRPPAVKSSLESSPKAVLPSKRFTRQTKKASEKSSNCELREEKSCHDQQLVIKTVSQIPIQENGDSGRRTPWDLRERKPINYAQQSLPITIYSSKSTTNQDDPESGRRTPWELRDRKPMSYTEMLEIDYDYLDAIEEPPAEIIGRVTRSSTRKRKQALLLSTKSNGYGRTRSSSKIEIPTPSSITKVERNANVISNNGIKRGRGRPRKNNAVIQVMPPTSIKTRSSTRQSYRAIEDNIRHIDDYNNNDNFNDDDDNSCIAEIDNILNQNSNSQFGSDYLKKESMRKWRPPTPPRKGYNDFVPIDWGSMFPRSCSRSRSRRDSVRSVRSIRSEYSVYSHLTNGKERTRRHREVSPSEVEFLPRLRSGRDPSWEHQITPRVNICRLRPASTPLFTLPNLNTRRATTPH